MINQELEEKIQLLVQRYPKFDRQVYYFLFEALDHAIVNLGKARKQGPARHVSGRELLEAVKEVAQNQFGLLAKAVLNSWGVETTEDFGRVVFIMVEAQLLHKQDSDSMDDFKKAFDFEEAFEKGYEFDIPWESFTRGTG